MSKLVTRKQWARKICAIHARTVQGVFQMGRELLAAKKKLRPGTFTAMIESDLPFGKRAAQMLMAVAADPRLTKRTIGSLLPATWRTLYAITRLTDAQFAQALTSGAINPQMTRRDVVTITERPSRPLLDSAALERVRQTMKVTHRSAFDPVRIAAAAVPLEAPERPKLALVPKANAPPPPAADDATRATALRGFSATHLVERFAHELGEQIKRGAITVDVAFCERVEGIVNQLKAELIEETPSAGASKPA